MSVLQIAVMIIYIFILFNIEVSCQLLAEYAGRSQPNNSVIKYKDIGTGDYALKCVTDNVNCCNDASVGNWRDVRGSPVQEGRDGTSCLYVTRGDGEISLNRKSDCFDHTSGLWRCATPDSSGDMQILYIYISKSRSLGSLKSVSHNYTIILLITGQLNTSVSMTFTLHTGLRTSVPEFTISCRTHGGPATTVQWRVNGVSVEEDSDHETSQIILDASHNSVYDNRLRVRGRTNGNYSCSISSNIIFFFPNASIGEVNGSQMINGKLCHFLSSQNIMLWFFTQLQKFLLILLLSSLSPTVVMSM